MSPEEWERDPTDRDGNALSRPYVNVGAVFGPDEDIARILMPHPFQGDA